MSIAKMKKEDLELLSNKDITYMLLEESKKSINTAKLFQKIIKLLDLPESTFENKIADYYTSLATDKRFILLSDGTWDLRNRHTSDKVIVTSEDNDEEDDELDNEDDILDEDNEDDYSDDDDNVYDDTKEDLKDLVVIDEDDIDELEQ